MRYFKNIGLFGLLFMVSTTLRAQENYTSLSFGVGQFTNNPASGSVSYTIFSHKDISQVSRFGPQFSLNLESLINEKWGIGLQLQYVNAQSDRDTRTTGSLFGTSRIIENVVSNGVGGEFNLKYFYYREQKSSLYAVGYVGGFFVSENATTSSGVKNVYINSWLSVSGGAGIRYFFSDKFGVFGELSYRRLGPPSGVHFNGGIIMKI
jgi:hypothetical protein